VQPLYIKPNAGFDINGFWLPQSGDVVTVPQGGEVLFACPGSTLSGVGSSEAVLTCVGGKQFEVLFNFCSFINSVWLCNMRTPKMLQVACIEECLHKLYS